MFQHFELNVLGRDFVVGDIHGCFTLLQDELRRIGFDESKDRLFSVGDLVDRGLESEDSLKWINKSWLHAVRGNHEQMAIDTFNGEWDAGNYLINGGGWFLDLSEDEQRNYVALFETLPYVIDVQTKNGLVGIVHANCPVDDWNILEENLNSSIMVDAICDSILWDRTRINFSDTSIVENVYKVIVGHTPVDGVPYELGNVLFIDTGAVFVNNLTIIEI